LEVIRVKLVCYLHVGVYQCPEAFALSLPKEISIRASLGQILVL
jgi:hypothetical protein